MLSFDGTRGETEPVYESLFLNYTPPSCTLSDLNVEVESDHDPVLQFFHVRKRREMFTRPWEWKLNRHTTILFYRGNSAPPLCFGVLGCVEKSSTQFFRFCGTQKDRAHIIISRLNVNFASRCHINMTEGCDMWQGNLHQDVINRAHNFSLTFSADIITS